MINYEEQHKLRLNVMACLEEDVDRKVSQVPWDALMESCRSVPVEARKNGIVITDTECRPIKAEEYTMQLVGLPVNGRMRMCWIFPEGPVYEIIVTRKTGTAGEFTVTKK